MKKHLILALSLVAITSTAQNVMKVEHQSGKVDRYHTNDVKHVELQLNDQHAFSVENQKGSTIQYTVNDTRRLFFDAVERDDSLFQTDDGMRQYLVNLYHMQRHGLPFADNKSAWSGSCYNGMPDAFTDCYQLHWSAPAIWQMYYYGNLSANYPNDNRYAQPLISYTDDWVWETVSMAWRLIEDINRVDELSQDERNRMVAEAKCLIACRYFDLLPYYGGLPIVKNSNSGTNKTCELPRATFAETVDFMVGLLDEAIPVLPWAKDSSRAEYDGFNRFWTAAGAKALKAKILLLAASPLFNNEQSYYDGTTEAEQKHLVWYGNYDATRWQRALKACEDFFQSNGEPDPLSATLGTDGTYHLVTATKKNANGYRQAYRMGYIDVQSPEVIHSNRAYSLYNSFNAEYGNGGREEAHYGSQASYMWWSFVGLGRHSYLPTEEYVEMFPWSDGQPFNWETDLETGKINGSDGQLFYKYGKIKTPSRDPRLYENAIVNGMTKSFDWNTGTPSGDIYELWIGGADAQQTVAAASDDGAIVEALTSPYSDGYGVMKYYLGEEYHRKPLHWVALGYNEMLLIYAECLAQTGHLNEVLNCVNQIRARVGMKTLESFNSELTSNKNLLIEEILRERACELGMSGNRYFDQCRYMRGDWMVKPLHGLLTYRLNQNSSHNFNPWIGYEKNTGVAEPKKFEYQRFELIYPRSLCGKDPSSKDVKRMFLWPFPTPEIKKNYGLIQNPGW